MRDWEDASISLIEPDTLLRGRYRVIQSLSYGGFGETFQVIDEAHLLANGTYALKVLKVLNLRRFQESKSRHKSIDLFKREATVLSRLRHPGIPRVERDGYFTWPENRKLPLHCLVMEYIEGRSLDVWLRQRQNEPLGQDLALEWLQQILNILHVIHTEKLIHRDIKPSNIMLTASGQLVLIDFGAVRDTAVTYLQSQGTGNTATRIYAAGYTPHEQVEGRAREESDFFALARTFVHLMSGIHPMGMEINDKTGKLAWRDHVPHLSSWFADVLDAMMETFPGNRPHSAQQILNQLQGTSLHGSIAPPVADSSISNSSKSNSSHSLLVDAALADVDPWAAFPTVLSPDDWANVRVKRVLQGHRDQIRAIAIHPDSGMLVSASFDGTIKLWLLPDGTPIATFEGQGQRITAVAVSDDGMTIASGGYDRDVRIWSLSDGELLHRLQRQPDTLQAVVFVPEKPIVISATGTTVKLWSTQSGTLIAALPHRFRSIRSLAISPDGMALAIGSLSGTVELWNPFSRTRIWQTSYQLDGTTSVCFSPDGNTLACATGAMIELLNLKRKRIGLLESRQPRALSAIAFSPDGRVLASASGTSVELWSIVRKKRLSPPLISHQKPVRSLAFTPNGKMLVSGGADHKLVLWQPVKQ